MVYVQIVHNLAQHIYIVCRKVPGGNVIKKSPISSPLLMASFCSAGTSCSSGIHICEVLYVHLQKTSARRSIECFFPAEHVTNMTVPVYNSTWFEV
jgi:hypothetical protein